MEKLEWHTKQVKVKDLVQLDINPRKITDEKKQELIKSLEKFNLVEIPAINTDMQIIGGNQRVTTLMLVGRGDEYIDVRMPNRKLTTTEVKEYAVISNTHAGEFDFDILKLEFSDIELDDIGFDIDGFDDWQIKQDKLLFDEAEEDDFEVPEGGSETDIVLGDLFEIGEHRLLCGDSTCNDTVAKLMAGDKADMVFTDPPYGVSYAGGHNEKKRKGIENDELVGVDLSNLFQDSINTACVFSKSNAPFYIWYAGGKSIETFEGLSQTPIKVRAIICWYKVKSGLGAFMSQYIPNYEPCIYGHKEGESIQWFGATDEKTVWEFKRDSVNEYHPTQKPIEVVSRAVNNSSKKKQMIYDAFLGSGSTMVASHQLKRKCYGMELDPKYCQVIIDRMLKLDPSLKIIKNGLKYDRVL